MRRRLGTIIQATNSKFDYLFLFIIYFFLLLINYVTSKYSMLVWSHRHMGENYD